MATMNPVAIVRNVQSSKDSSRQVHEIVGRIAGGGAHEVTLETKCKSVLAAQVVNETDTALLACVIGDSTTFPGTKTVVFTVANAKTYHYRVTGILALTATVDTTGGATAIIYEPIKGA